MNKFQIWYMQHGYFRDGSMGYEFCKEHNRLPDIKHLTRTHTHLMDKFVDDKVFEGARLDEIYANMQGEVWSPNGEGSRLINEKCLTHTSMSVGDIIVQESPERKVWFVDHMGFKELS